MEREKVQEVIFKYYPNCSDLKRTWQCADAILALSAAEIAEKDKTIKQLEELNHAKNMMICNLNTKIAELEKRAGAK